MNNRHMNIDQTELKEAGVHFGNLVRKWNPHMQPYIYQKSQKIYILDWQKIIVSGRKLVDYCREMVVEGKTILFLATKKATREAVKEQAISCGMPYIVNKWKGGFLTNFTEIRKKLKELQGLTAFIQKDNFRNLIKKEQVAIQKRREKLYNLYEGVINCNRQPDALFIIGLGFEKTAWKEAKKLALPIIAVCNTNCNPRSVDYVLPGNDEETKSISFFARLMANTIKKIQAEKRARISNNSELSSN